MTGVGLVAWYAASVACLALSIGLGLYVAVRIIHYAWRGPNR